MREQEMSAPALKLCAQCQHTDYPKRGGSAGIELILWCCAIVPGLIYSVWRNGQQTCPICHGKSMLPLDTPRALEILGAEKLAAWKLEEATNAKSAEQQKITKRGYIVKAILLVAFIGYLVVLFS